MSGKFEEGGVMSDSVNCVDAELVHKLQTPTAPPNLNINKLSLSTGIEKVQTLREIFSEDDQQSNLHVPVVLPNALLSNSGLALLASQYDSSEDEDFSSRSDAKNVQEIIPTCPNNEIFRNNTVQICSESDSESNASSSDLEFISYLEESQELIEADIVDEQDFAGRKNKGPIRVKGEILLEDLPSIEDLQIKVAETDCVELGKIHSIVDQLVLVDSVLGMAVINLDTVLFLEQGQKVLGEVFDVLGQIQSPLYCVRFNSNHQIKERNLEIGQTVYIAPRTEHTHFVILKDMMQLRGSDASWENDIEPNEKHLDYSDDEEERNARRSIRNRDRFNNEMNSAKKERLLEAPTSQSLTVSSRHQKRPQYYRHSDCRKNSPYQYISQICPHSNDFPSPAAAYSVPYSYGYPNPAWNTNYQPGVFYANPSLALYIYNEIPFAPRDDAVRGTSPPR